jgi:hypothetical protein
LIDKGIKEYIHLQDTNNEIYQFIRENKKKMNEMDMLIELLKSTENYGLSDTILLEMMKKIR